MAMNPLFRSTQTRMMGLSSGMDTEYIIQQTLRLHQFKIDNRMRAKKLLEWKQQSLNGIKDELTGFRRSFLTGLGASAMGNRNTYNSTIAAITGKYAGAVSISTMYSSSVGTMRIGQVVSLAKGASVSSSGSVSEGGGGFGVNATLDSLKFNGGSINFSNYLATVKAQDGTSTTLSKADVAGAVWGDAKSTIKVGDTDVELVKGDDGKLYYNGDEVTFTDGTATITVGDETVTLTNLEDGQIQHNGKTLTFVAEADVNGVTLYKVDNGPTQQIQNEGKLLEFVGETKFKIFRGPEDTEGTEITLKSNMTISQMIQAVNSSGAGVTMKYDRLQDKFSIESNTVGGAAGSLSVSEEGTNNALEMFGLTGGTNAGTMAVVWINGEKITRDTNSFEYRGVNITLNYTTDTTSKGRPEDIDTDLDATVATFTRDATDAISKIKSFIDAYNTIIKKLEGLLAERKKGNEVSYKPLTDEEKSGMTDKQIEEWEAIARKGLLKNDTGIQSMVTSLRNALFDQVESAGLSAADIGISTGSYFGGTGGQIVLDEEKLRAALESDPEKVANVFAGTDGNRGLVWRMDTIMSDYVNGYHSRSLTSLEESLKRANEQIDKMTQKMHDEEDKLYRKFAAMETALSKIQSQGDWFAAMLGNNKQ